MRSIRNHKTQRRKNHLYRKTAKKFDQNENRQKIRSKRKPHSEPSKPITFHISVINRSDAVVASGVNRDFERTKVSQLFEISGGA